MRVVTIDGPGGAGKSTVARLVAARLGWRLLDTGAMYRAATLAALRSGVRLDDEAAFADLVATLTVEFADDGRVLLTGEDVSGEIRTVEVTRSSRHAADNRLVRELLNGWQRAFALVSGSVVTEGRDQGTIVFPDAFRKFFLTASDEERARRRHAELVARGESIGFDVVLNELRERDARDEARAIAPLRPAADARIIDSTGLSSVEVADRIEAEIVDDGRSGGVRS